MRFVIILYDSKIYKLITIVQILNKKKLKVFIGGWKNTKSVIRKNNTQPDVVEAITEGYLTNDEFRGFWIR